MFMFATAKHVSPRGELITAFVHLFIRPSGRVSTRQSVSLSVLQSVSLPVCLSIYPCLLFFPPHFVLYLSNCLYCIHILYSFESQINSFILVRTRPVALIREITNFPALLQWSNAVFCFPCDRVVFEVWTILHFMVGYWAIHYARLFTLWSERCTHLRCVFTPHLLCSRLLFYCNSSPMESYPTPGTSRAI